MRTSYAGGRPLAALALALALMLTGPAIHAAAAPLAAAHPAIAYHTLPAAAAATATAAPGAGIIYSVVSGPGGRVAATAAAVISPGDTDWDVWHSRWMR
jgi:hypothetical protein